MSQVKPFDKKAKSPEIRIQRILHKIETMKLSDSFISQIQVPKREGKFREVLKGKSRLYPAGTLAVVIIGMLVQWFFKDFSSKSCLLGLPSSAKPLFRPPEQCSMCSDVEGVVRISNTSAEDFERYAYSAAPVIVTDATENWKALQEFNFKFFADFYAGGKMGHQINDCFFFAYKSGFNSLEEVFAMDEGRANLSGDPWYVGWSTCHSEETRRLRSYYARPYFLPPTAESDMVDWVFMGGPGQGAHMHVDSVKHMSWQAQVRGRKRWTLAPPPECLYRCRWLAFTVQPGEILVVDTNRWYHQTTALPGDISITIGAEYD